MKIIIIILSVLIFSSCEDGEQLQREKIAKQVEAYKDSMEMAEFELRQISANALLSSKRSADQIKNLAAKRNERKELLKRSWTYRWKMDSARALLNK